MSRAGKIVRELVVARASTHVFFVWIRASCEPAANRQLLIPLECRLDSCVLEMSHIEEIIYHS